MSSCNARDSIADPPSSSGAVHDTTAPEFSGLATTDVDAPGVVYGVTDAEFADSTPVPAALIAETRNTYAVPLVSPVTVADAPQDVKQFAEYVTRQPGGHGAVREVAEWVLELRGDKESAYRQFGA
mgnify:CR=1 FL=1